jgi:hypothetical protein
MIGYLEVCGEVHGAALGLEEKLVHGSLTFGQTWAL